MKHLLMCIVCLWASAGIFAQEKRGVVVMPFVSTLEQNKGVAAQVQEMVVKLLSANAELDVIDRSKDKQVVAELNNQIREVSVLAKSLADQGKLGGAKEIIVGTITTVSAEPVKNGTSGIGYLTGGSNAARYSGVVVFSLQLIDVETGTLKEQQTFNGNTKNTDAANKAVSGLKSVFGKTKGTTLTEATSDVITAETKEKAIQAAIQSNEKPITNWVGKIFPPQIKILAVQSYSKGNPETILVAGLGDIYKKGSSITVNEVQYFDLGNGKKAKQVKKIGELKIQELQGEVTLCKVTDGESVLDEKIKNKASLEFVVK